MPRPKKDAKILNVRLDAGIHEKLEQFCDETGMSKTTAVEKILEQYFATYFQRPEDERTLFR